jgi:hypothetical protein
MLDARPGFIIKFLKRSLIVKFYLKQSKARVINKNLRSENVSETLY